MEHDSCDNIIYSDVVHEVWKNIHGPHSHTLRSFGKNSKLMNSYRMALGILKDHLIRAKRCLDVGSSGYYLTVTFAKLSDAVIYRIEDIEGDLDDACKVPAKIEEIYEEYLADGKIVLIEGYVENTEKAFVTYDVIYVKSAASIGMEELTDEIPNEFVRKLANGGRMVISKAFAEMLVVDKDKDGKVTKRMMQHPKIIQPLEELQIKKSIMTKCHRAIEKPGQKPQTNAFKGIPIRENDTSLKVITEEKRQHFKKTDEFPFSAVGLLKVVIENQDPLTGTGVLVAPNLVLTAAHNIVDNRDKFKRACYSNIEFIAGMNEGVAPFGTCKVIDSFVPEEFLKTGEREDYALLVLDRDVGIEAGYFGVHATNLQDLKALREKKQEILVLGYPRYVLNEQKERVWLTSKGYHQLWGMGSNDWIIEEDLEQIHYVIQTSPGQSGGCVFYKSGVSVYVLGVHIFESGQLNTATWMTIERFDRIQKFFKQKQPIRGKGDSLVDRSAEMLKCMALKGSSLMRVSKEITNFFKDPVQGIFLESATGNQIFGRFNGPGDTPFEGGVFKFVLEIPEQYPYKPPKINLLTRIFHPNIEDSSGFICMDILMDQWSPALMLDKTILSVVSLLTTPNAVDAVEPENARLYLKDKARYEATAREWTLKYAV